MSICPFVADAAAGEERKKSGDEDATLLPFCGRRPTGEDIFESVQSYCSLSLRIRVKLRRVQKRVSRRLVSKPDLVLFWSCHSLYVGHIKILCAAMTTPGIYGLSD